MTEPLGLLVAPKRSALFVTINRWPLVTLDTRWLCHFGLRGSGWVLAEVREILVRRGLFHGPIASVKIVVQIFVL